MKARGATITITQDSIDIQRSELARNLWPDASIPASELIGWYKRQPDTFSPGHIELLTNDSRVRVNFSAGEQKEYTAVDSLLTQLQAGYDLDASVAEDNASPSVSEWVEDAAAASEGGVEGGTEAETKQAGSGSQRAPWAKVATPDVVPEPNKDADIDNPLYGQVVCVTGDVEPYSKGDVWNLIAGAGATVSKSVTKKTTMLIVGEWATMTSKEKRARELKDKGQDISIVEFKDFLDLV